jgi:two-component system LytT family response regulator
MLGRTLSRYRIDDELGRGGMGIVYRARDTKLQRDVALKVLSADRLADPELRRRFLQEARALAALQHPGIAVVHEIDEADGMAFIAMELIRGERLQDLLAREELDLSALLGLALEIAEALAEAHGKGIVHRDLKPTNVLVTPERHAKLVDFGLAKLFDPVGELGDAVDTPARGHTDPGRILGTVAYLSPEQVRGQAVDPRSDVFGFGSLLYEMLAGEPAFRSRSPIETMHAILSEPAPRLPDLGRDGARCAAELGSLLDRCLAKEPADRYADAGAVAADLRAVRERLASGARLAPTPPRAPKPRASGGRLRVAIVDDEELARRLLREYLAAHADVEIVAECANGFEAVKAVAEQDPDLLFLDVQMPKLTGFEVLELIGREIAVVFVTAYDEFALKAFEVHAIDYLLKPIAPERLAEALARARQRIVRPEPLPVAELAAAARQRSGPLERILVRQGSKVHVIPAGKLDYAEAQDDYVCLRSEGKEYLKEQTLAELESVLDSTRFVRIHRSYVMNVERLAKIELYAKDSRVAILADGTRLPVSRAGYARLKVLLG